MSGVSSSTSIHNARDLVQKAFTEILAEHAILWPEADEEEEEQVAGLQDFVFTVNKKMKKNDVEKDDADDIDEDESRTRSMSFQMMKVTKKPISKLERKCNELRRNCNKKTMRRMPEAYDGRLWSGTRLASF